MSDEDKKQLADRLCEKIQVTVMNSDISSGHWYRLAMVVWIDPVFPEVTEVKFGRQP
jgi:hypothetical protein